MWRSRVLATAIAVLVVVPIVGIEATSAGAGVTTFSDPSISYPYAITTGPDGALWFTDIDNNSIGRITTAGVVTEYTDPSIS